MMKRALGISVILAVGPGLATAQDRTIPWSQRGAVEQRVGFTDVTITYRRPVARGRTLVGGLVRWGRVWNPGADSATTITVSRDIEVEGQPLASGHRIRAPH